MTGPVDVHQHLWPEPFLDALRRRSVAPYLDGWTLHTTGEAPFAVDPAHHDPTARTNLDHGVDRIVLAMSSPLGIEDLPPDEAVPLLDAWHDGIRALGGPYAGWAAVASTEPDLAGLADLLTDPAVVGLQVPATALATPAALESLAPALAVAESAGRPVFVHPGPARPTPGTPPWWPAVVDYVSQLHAAWWAWFVAGRPLLPDLRICFVGGAGLAPAQHERFRERGGGPFTLDPGVFVDTSSYGRQGIDALVRALGVDAVVLGTDRPYAALADLGQGAAAWHAISHVNPNRLLQGAAA
jgi:predicted TIM-barrel fold metal-dependent hydrolase